MKSPFRGNFPLPSIAMFDYRRIGKYSITVVTHGIVAAFVRNDMRREKHSKWGWAIGKLWWRIYPVMRGTKEPWLIIPYIPHSSS